MPDWPCWIGVIHAHSTHSDGKGDVRRVLRAARRTGADFVLLTDHDTLAGRRHLSGPAHSPDLKNGKNGGPPPQGAGRRNNADEPLLIVGCEITCRGRQHYLAAGIDEAPRKGLPPAEAIARVRRQGGAGFLAHPFDRGSPYLKLRFEWKEWEAQGFDGLEIWTYMTDFYEELKSFWDLPKGFLFPDRNIQGPAPEDLARWDALNAAAWEKGLPIVAGLGAVDAHGYLLYRREMRTIRTHVIPPAPETPLREEEVIAALRSGRSFIAHDGRAPAAGFRLRVRAAGQLATMGATVKKGRQAAAIEVTAPRIAHLRLIHNGQVKGETRGRSCAWALTRPGVYRVEAHLPGRLGKPPRAWIYSNPVFVYD